MSTVVTTIRLDKDFRKAMDKVIETLKKLGYNLDRNTFLNIAAKNETMRALKFIRGEISQWEKKDQSL